MPSGLRPWLGLAIRLTAAGVWLVAGVAKIADLDHFHAQVRAYELLPGALEAPFAYALPFVEVGLASVLRDAALGLPSLVLAVWPARLASLDHCLLGRPDPYRIRV